MYSQKDTNGNEYGYTDVMFNNDADVLIGNFEKHMLDKSKNNNW